MQPWKLYKILKPVHITCMYIGKILGCNGKLIRIEQFQYKSFSLVRRWIEQIINFF